MNITLHIADEVNLVAIYAAFVSSVVLIWDIIKWWRTGPRLHGHAKGNMQMIGGARGRDPSSYIVFTVYNRGSANVTLTNVGLLAYSSRWAKFRRKSDRSFVVNATGDTGYTVPYVLKAGEQFMTLARQDSELEALTRSHQVYGAIYHTYGDKPLLLRIPPIPDDKAQT